MAKSGWMGRLQEQRKVLLIVSVHTSLQQCVVHRGFLNHTWFLSIWQFSTGSAFLDPLKLLLVSKQNISGEYVRISLDLRHLLNKFLSDNQIVRQKDAAYFTKWFFGKGECNLVGNKVMLSCQKNKVEKKKRHQDNSAQSASV